MRIKQIQMKAFRRFTDLTIRDLPPTARLILMVGPNGCGKSCVFDALRYWFWSFNAVPPQRKTGMTFDDQGYYPRQGLSKEQMGVNVAFHEPPEGGEQGWRKALYIRSAYRNEPDFKMRELPQVPSALSQVRFSRIIDNDVAVSENYRRLVSMSIKGLYDTSRDDLTVRQLRDALIGKVRQSMVNVFGDLVLQGPGSPLEGGTFYFEKGTSKGFLYKNLSGGEKAGFDLLLDLIIKREEFDNTAFCMDEPEAHIHTKLQGRLLEEIFSLLPDKCQLWVATHSIGMMRKARDLQEKHPDEVAFLDFEGIDFDATAVITHRVVDRVFWKKVLAIAVDDMADLVAPRTVVICEGAPKGTVRAERAAFDAKCYQTIFASEFPEAEFVSAGSSDQVRDDFFQLQASLQPVVPGVKFIRLLDRDDRSAEEVAELSVDNVRVLSRRSIESYLLDDEVLDALCQKYCDQERCSTMIDEVKKARSDCLKESATRGNPDDDWASAAGALYTKIKGLLELKQCGNTPHAFLSGTLAPLMRPDMQVYRTLKEDIFCAR